jgi:hypothetical protein
MPVDQTDSAEVPAQPSQVSCSTNLTSKALIFGLAHNSHTAVPERKALARG